MKLRLLAATLAVAAALCVPAQADEPVAMVRYTPAQIASMAASAANAGKGPGPQMTNLVGDPAKAGLYTVRVAIPAHTQVRPHTHRDNRSVTVLSGKWEMGYG